MIRAIKKLILGIQAFYHLSTAYLSDFVSYCKWSRTFLRDRAGDRLQKRRANMMLLIHSLEKGMSAATPKAGFGKEKSAMLLEMTERYIRDYGVDQYSRLALGVLHQYANNVYAGRNEALQHNITNLLKASGLSSEDLNGGTKSYDPMALANCYEQAFAFVASRCSVRDFDTRDIPNEDVFKAIRFAQSAPTACNRQACRIHIFADKDVIHAVLENQFGNQGWAHGANRLFVVTSLFSHFDGVFERYQMYIDGGMVAMQFILGLHSLKIASCCKMYVRTPAADKEFYRLTQIPKNETPIVLVFAGCYKDEPANVPASFRLPTTEIGIWH
ncbi:MAG: nitroreductase family protein [Lentisphaeria bacterium]|jgi:nitroreductase